MRRGLWRARPASAACTSPPAHRACLLRPAAPPAPQASTTASSGRAPSPPTPAACSSSSSSCSRWARCGGWRRAAPRRRPCLRRLRCARARPLAALCTLLPAPDGTAPPAAPRRPRAPAHRRPRASAPLPGPPQPDRGAAGALLPRLLPRLRQDPAGAVRQAQPFPGEGRVGEGRREGSGRPAHHLPGSAWLPACPPASQPLRTPTRITSP